MKDTIITAKAKKREFIIFGVSLLAAILVNIYAIISYGTEWSELYSMAGMVVAIAVFFYVVQWIIRLIIRLTMKLVRSLKLQNE